MILIISSWSKPLKTAVLLKFSVFYQMQLQITEFSQYLFVINFPNNTYINLL